MPVKRNAMFKIFKKKTILLDYVFMILEIAM